MHSSASLRRSDAPKCHPETRKAVQDKILSWMSPSHTHSSLQSAEGIFWLTGPAGTGKTEIIGTIADKIDKAGQLAASFYFSSKGMVETMSKQCCVTTLAYQLAVHPALKDILSTPILSAIRESPEVFSMSLERQFEVLILQPLRCMHPSSTPSRPLFIVVDGVDQCGAGRSRQDDQVEVLSILLQTVNNPAFPFRVIVASRPETWIRTFFTESATGKFIETFLDNKYDPDVDIRLYLKSKFAKLCRRYQLDPSWPSEEVIDKLVENASGQFVYAATVLRFVDKPGTLPQTQLRTVLEANPKNNWSPFSSLDALYGSIIRSGPRPKDTVLWLKGLQVLNALEEDDATRHLSLAERARRKLTKLDVSHLSAWTVDQLFEANAGEARIHFDPSLVGINQASSLEFGSALNGAALEVSPLPPPTGWNGGYYFYHKSLLDYLDDPGRCGAAVPYVDSTEVERWVSERCTMCLMRKHTQVAARSFPMLTMIITSPGGGPEVVIDQELLPVFRRCFLDLFMDWTAIGHRSIVPGDSLLSRCELTEWLHTSMDMAFPYSSATDFPRRMYVLVHQTVSLPDTTLTLWY